MNATLDQIAPDLLQTLAYQADTRGLSANEYLRHLLGLSNGASAPSALADTPEAAPPRNEEMLATIQRSRERLKDMPVRGSTEETLKMIRRARAGEMWGYEPIDPECENNGCLCNRSADSNGEITAELMAV
jgi:hypothetical protein